MRTRLIAIVGLASLAVGFVLVLALPGLVILRWATLALGAALLAAALILDFRQVKDALASRRGRQGTVSAVGVVVFGGILLLANAISAGTYHRFDLTGLAQFTLSSQTKEVLGKLETPVSVVAFFVPGDPLGDYVQALLSEYSQHTTALKVRHVDPDESPDLVRELGASQVLPVVFSTEQGRRLVSTQDIALQAEHSFTSAILEVTGVKQKSLCFLGGHGEVDIHSTAPDGYSFAREALLSHLYKVRTLDLYTDSAVPEDCTALVIATPERELSDAEIRTVEQYLADNGWALILLNPDPPESTRRILNTYGIDVEDGIVVDLSDHAVPSVSTPLVAAERSFFGLPLTYFPGATALIPIQEASEQTAMIPLAWTSRRSWLEKDFSSEREPTFDQGIDAAGPLALGVLVTKEADETPENPSGTFGTRLIVVGDSDFASNRNYYSGNNGELFLNLVELLTAGKTLVSIDRKALQFRRLVVDPGQARFITYSSILLIPLLLLVIAGFLWWRRR